MNTITAISTPIGMGGIGIIRISGKKALDTLEKIFVHNKQTRKLRQKHFVSHTFYHGFIYDGNTDFIIDEVMVVYMKSPNSYTREDVIEIQSHSNNVVLNLILDLVLRSGDVSLAEPGEFTKRSFLNGRIDLTQAESVIDIISAKSIEALKISNESSMGFFNKKIKCILEKIIPLISTLEATIDFQDDIEDDINTSQYLKVIELDLLPEIQELMDNFRKRNYVNDGINLSIIGAPNVGKSSLMNRLSEKQSSIVTSVPGTTRDIIQNRIMLEGKNLLISDTAGIHDTEDLIERIGVDLSIKMIDDSDLILFMFDASKGLTKNDISILDLLKKKRYFLIANKKDKAEHPVFISNKPADENEVDRISISAKYGDNIDNLQSKIKKALDIDFPDGKNIISPNLRQFQLLDNINNMLLGFLENHSGYFDYELVALDLKEILRTLHEITGESNNDEILDHIFQNFCIGK